SNLTRALLAVRHHERHVFLLAANAELLERPRGNPRALAPGVHQQPVHDARSPPVDRIRDRARHMDQDFVDSRHSRYRLPTADGGSSSPNSRASTLIARQPVQWPGAKSFRPNRFRSRTVSGMIFSVTPERWRPPIAAKSGAGATSRAWVRTFTIPACEHA